MMQIVVVFLYSLVLVSSLLYIWHKLLDKKINFKNPRLYITLISLIIISVFNYFVINKFIKIMIILVVFMLFFRFLFKESIHKCVITSFFYEIVIIISEMLYATILTLILKNDANSIINNYFGAFFSNVMIAIISVLIILIPFVKNLYNKIIYFTEKTDKNKLIMFSFFLIIITNIFGVFTYYKVNFQFVIIFNAISTIVCYFIVIYSFHTQSNYNKVSDKYNIAITSLKDYETMMTKYRIANHENKNLLLTIRAMILNEEKDIPKYINSIIEERYEDDDKLLLNMSVIPSGGLRATIYSEILKIKENNINYSLNIDKKLSTIDLIGLDEKTIIDICKIVGVFIDNAIEEVIELKNKDIKIDLYTEKNIIYIKVSNNYRKSVDIDKIYENGYTTKGNNHGYGLSLVKIIIEKNGLLSNKLELTKNLFSQILMIKYKK